VSRVGRVERVTKETSVLVEVGLDGTGRVEVATGVGFFDHMLAQLGKHGLFDLTVKTEGDLHIDPMIGPDYDTTMTRHILESLVAQAAICLHVHVPYGRNAHHIVEAQFKALARALREASEPDPRATGVPSTKGVL
jgi:imidazoleglycerol phosphate dehydratase HisB